MTLSSKGEQGKFCSPLFPFTRKKRGTKFPFLIRGVVPVYGRRRNGHHRREHCGTK